MKFKRIAALFLVLAMVLGISSNVVPALGLATAAAAIPARDAGSQYFGSQLTGEQALGAESRAFYDALVAMYGNGALRSGADQEVALSAEQVQAYLNGQSNLGHALTNARDAFYMDYPDLFYVNFNNFAFRVKNGAVCITPGTRGDGYLLAGITASKVDGLVTNYDAKLAELVQAGHSAVKAETENSQQAAAVRAVHDKLTEMLKYKLDNEVSNAENQKFIRTAYGIVTGEGVCEAYSRAFKSAMDSLGIHCVLVEGAFRHSADRVEAHMWALVQVEDKWYGVDVTMDDPDKPIVDAYGDATGRTAYDDYLLAGDVTMSAQHAASNTMSAASYEFTYPALTQNDYAVVTMHNSGGLKVRLDKTADGTNESGGGSGTFYVSYNGMSYQAAKEQGYYILARFMSVNTDAHFDGSGTTIPGDGEWSQTEDWGYLCPELFGVIKDTGTETELPMPHVRYVQFAVTDQKPGDYSGATSVQAIYEATHYQGDPSLLLAKTDVLFNPGGDYVAPPYIERAWPTQQSTMLIGQTYQIEAKMDDKLIPAEEGAELGYTLKAYAFYKGERKEYPSAEGFCTVGKPSLKENEDKTSSITFTFTPSEQWAHDTIFYEFNFTGVVGKKSGKKPNSLVYLASHPCTAYAYQSQGFDWNLYGKPQLMDDFENSDISIENWETKDGTKLPDELKHRMTLVVSNTTPNQKTDMEALAQSEAGQKPLATETYSINLTVCKKQIVKTGQAVRVMLGFPEPYGPDDAGVTFKAYHYSVDALGNITGVNEIPCIVTPQGLLVLCDSFSPFSVCALPAEQTAPGETETSKDVVVSTSCGGGSVTISGAFEKVPGSGVYTVDPGKSYEITVKAPGNKQISAITVGDRSIEVTNRDNMTFTLTYEELQGLMTGIVDVQFATAAWIREHEKDPAPALPEVKVSLSDSSITVNEGDALKITATAETATGETATGETATGETSQTKAVDGYIYTYKWFKDNVELKGHTGSELVIDPVKPTDAGSYQVEVALSSANAGTAQERTAKSEACKVQVIAAATPAPTQAPAGGNTSNNNNNNNNGNTNSGSSNQQANNTPAPAPAAPAVPAATPKPATGGSGSKTGGTIMAPATPTPAPATPAPALTNTPAPTPTPAPVTPAPEATVAPTATPAPETAKGGIPPLAVAGLVAAGLVAAGGLAWMFLPRRKQH